MKKEPRECEICGANNWLSLGKKIYCVADGEHPNNYDQKRLRVLFEKWFPGSSSVELTSVCCTKCGIVVHYPRPEKSDVDIKYRFLEELGQDYGQNTVARIEKKRSQDVLDYLSSKIELHGRFEVLDYGGGDGRLMHAFLEKGMSCAKVDYNTSCIPGITQLADTLDELSGEHHFDLIVCSHVIEHVADPLGVVKRLAQHLRPGASLFAEVPMEIWQEPPLKPEPVTHINFFTPNSMWNLLAHASLQVLESNLTRYLNDKGRWRHGVRALATRSGDTPIVPVGALRSPDIDEYLRPDLSAKFRYYWANWHAVCGAARFRITHSWKVILGRS